MPTVSDGYVLFSLVNPTSEYDPYCDAAFWDGYPDPGGPYLYCTIKLRVKALNPQKIGSRGWGLWYTENPPELQRQMWFMNMRDSTGPGYTGLDWWRAETANGRTEAVHHFTELDQDPYIVDNQQWHNYEIVRDPSSISLKVDGETVLYTTQNLPTERLAFHIWVDNLIYEHVDPDIINVYKRGWTGKNEIVLDYVQILSQGQLDQSETPAGIKLLRQIPNEVYSGLTALLWKEYNFNAPGNKVIILATARVEDYLDALSQPISDDDDIRFVIDGTDYGWNTANSFNGDAQGTMAKTLLIEQNISAGNRQLQVYAETSPLLYDVTVLGSSTGGVIFNQEFNETKASGSAELWKEISFSTRGGDVAIYVSGSADEDPTPSPSYHYGYQYSEYNDTEDDDLRITLDGTNYGYQTSQSLYGNRLFGEPKSILIVENLTQGLHTLRLYGQGTPTLYRVVIYGGNDDPSLPVFLSSFNAEVRAQDNLIKWITSSEINNLGFNLYRAESKNNSIATSGLTFSRINPELIKGAGTTSTANQYHFIDAKIQTDFYYWYILEDVSINGKTARHDTITVHRSIMAEEIQANTFQLKQNYPNPFNSSTQIEFYLPEDEPDLQVNIISAAGQLIDKLGAGSYAKGWRRFVWNGKNLNGQAVSTGVYLLKIQNPGRLLATRKMLLIK
jgi:hypothetical protein